MKPSEIPPEDEDVHLKRLLQSWRMEIPLPGGFQREVWNRLARVQSGQNVSRVTEWLEAMAALLARPAWSLSFAVILVMTGLGLGYWQARESNQRTENILAHRYVQSLAPYQIVSR